MPRFELHIVTPVARRHDVMTILAERYPEIAVVDVRSLPDGTERWVVDAPSAAHVDRWVAERSVAVRRGIDG